MAIAFVNNVGGSLSTTAGVATITLVPAQNCGAGNLVALAASAGSGVVVSSVSDTKGNAWSVDATQTSTGASSSLATTVQNAGALTTGDTITVTFASTGANKVVAAMEFSGVTAGARLDQFTSAAGTTSTTPSSGATAPTTNANDLVLGAIAWNQTSQRTFTKGAAYTAALEQDEASGSFLGVALEYQIVSVTGAQTADGTLSGAPIASASICAAYSDTPISRAWINPAFMRRSVGPFGARILAVERSLTGGASLMIGGASNVQTVSTLSPTVTASATLAKSTSSSRAASVAATATITKLAGKLVSAGVAGTATITKQAAKTLSATATATAVSVRLVAKLLTATAAASASIAKRAAKALATSVTAAAATVKLVAKTLAASVAASAAQTAIKVFLKTLTASVTATAILTRSAGKALSATLTATVTLTRLTLHALTASLTATATTLRRVAKQLNGAAAATASVAGVLISGVVAGSSYVYATTGRVARSAINLMTASGTPTRTTRTDEDATNPGGTPSRSDGKGKINQ